ncbi:MAG: nitrogenase molybdenum-iron protein subunit beta [Firmicutes bacterium HGW-Firmicutes-15]|nr:MAG: nitrogenase molybdenum-iron protein subunit beta [Firmicutes bacterium HGW-Firmicutes-15]
MIDLTSKEPVTRQALRINPIAGCQPLGAMYASLGIHGCMPHSYGTSGCSRFQKTLLKRHFRKSSKVTTSVLKESAAIFGGDANLKTAIKNIFETYNPEIVAVHTTCLSETIGDDIKACLYDFPIPEGKYLIHANTPSYTGSHITGFSNMVSSAIQYLAQVTANPNNKACILPGFINPGDMKEIKRISRLMGVDNIMFPDTCGVFGQRGVERINEYPAGGTKVANIIDLGNCKKTFALGKYASEAAAVQLKNQCGVPFKLMDLPIGIEATDRFIMELKQLGQQDVANDLEEEREQLIDIILDAHSFFYNKKVALFGDPDIIIALSEFIAGIGMIPQYAVTGTPGAYFEDRMQQIFSKYDIDGIAKSSADLFDLQQWLKNDPVDLLMGDTHGKLLARAEDVPLVRIGFPIMDRHVHSYLPIVGYRGAIRILEMILNALMDRFDRDHPENDLVFI